MLGAEISKSGGPSPSPKRTQIAPHKLLFQLVRHLFYILSLLIRKEDKSLLKTCFRPLCLNILIHLSQANLEDPTAYPGRCVQLVSKLGGLARTSEGSAKGCARDKCTRVQRASQLPELSKLCSGNSVSSIQPSTYLKAFSNKCSADLSALSNHPLQ